MNATNLRRAISGALLLAVACGFRRDYATARLFRERANELRARLRCERLIARAAA